eukprot:TRINITY_DN36256_c0_g2_i1.p1 TRINITY_DN36256_c0_g2~~TRINITY_DN36256_c0_g2_i1.p1  ORF type:complete len:363 (-),score=47.19 TRINITY_DN36256_c0_g2_i1:115-1203(-)
MASPVPHPPDRPTGKGTKRPHASIVSAGPVSPTVQSQDAGNQLIASAPPRQLAAGQRVQVFHRFQKNSADLWIPVSSVFAGQCSPRIGTSDGWMSATVTRDWHQEMPGTAMSTTTPSGNNSDISVRFRHRLWSDRRGNITDSTKYPDLCERVSPEQVRVDLSSDDLDPELTFVVVRWGGETRCDPVTDGDGGWGPTGSNVSDPYVKYFFERVVWPTMGPNYQVLTVFVRHSSDLAKIHPPSLLHMCHARKVVGMYFLWPSCFQDSADMPGYVNQAALIQLMSDMEATGIITKFPHHAHLYRQLISKDWMAHLALMPGYNVPATTKVSRGLILDHPERAARLAVDALESVSYTHLTLPTKRIV